LVQSAVGLRPICGNKLPTKRRGDLWVRPHGRIRRGSPLFIER
jgi:hypothetical protein